MPHSKYLMALICALFTLFPRTSSFYGEKLVAFSKGNVLVVGIFNIYKQGNDSQCSEETEPAGMLEFETALYMLKQISKRLNRISNVHDGTIGYKFYGSCGILQNLVQGVVNIINDEYPIHYFLVLRSMESAEIFTSILSSYKISHIFYGISNFRQITPLLQSTFTTTVFGLSQIMEILIRLTKDWNLDNVQVFYSSEYSSPFFNQLIEQFCSEDLLEMDDTTNLKEENFLQDKSVWNILILITNNVHTMQILENLEEGNHGNFTVITINSDVIHKNMHLHTALDGAVVLMNNVYALPDRYFPNLEKLYNESQIKTFLSTLDEESEKLTSLVDSMLAIEEAYLNLRTVCALQMYACTRNKESLYTALVSATFQGVASKMTFYKNGNIRKDVELVNLIFNGSSLQGQRLGTFSMFKNSFVDMQPYGKGSRAFNFAKLSAAMCNKVCKSNEIKLKTEKKCCWVCQMCKPYEVIVKRGYERCERCPKLFFTNNEQTACIKIQPYYIKSFSHQGILLIVLSFLGITLLLTSLCLIHANRKHPYIKSIYSVPSLTIAVGIMLTFVVPLTFIGYPKVLKCSFYYFFENSQVIFVSVPMLYKLEAMARGFDHRVYRNRSNERPFYFNLFCCLIDLIWVMMHFSLIRF